MIGIYTEKDENKCSANQLFKKLSMKHNMSDRGVTKIQIIVVFTKITEGTRSDKIITKGSLTIAKSNKAECSHHV